MTASQQIMRHEGLRLMPYSDTEGHLTVGYGHLVANGISEAVADKLLREDILLAEADARSLLGKSYRLLNRPRQAVLVNMAFNLGLPRLKRFRRMIQEIELGAYASAAREMLDSKWAQQVGGRAVELAEQMRTGQWARL